MEKQGTLKFHKRSSLGEKFCGTPIKASRHTGRENPALRPRVS